MAAGRALRTIACWLGGLILSFALILPLPAGRAQVQDVDLALILAIDCSFSVDAREFALQMDGIGRAFMRDDVKKAIAQGHRQRIAVAVVQWSDDRNQIVTLPWTVVAGAAGTSTSSALAFSAALFATAPSAERQVIDVSTDGRNNSGPPVSPMRDRLVGEGITINGLTILNEWPTLDSYFENNVAGGVGYFVIPANDYEDYGEAMFRKLLREITGPGIT